MEQYASLDDIIPKAQRIVSLSKLAYVLDLHEEEVKLMVDARMIVETKNTDGDVIKGKFDLIKTLQKLLKDRETEAHGNPRTTIGRMDMAKMQKLQSQAERELLHNEMLKGSVVRMDDVDAEVTDMILAVKSKLLGFPAHIARLILAKEDFDEVCAIMTQELEKALIDLASPSSEAIYARNRKLQKYTEGVEQVDAVKIRTNKGV
jgi:hypothetical protein